MAALCCRAPLHLQISRAASPASRASLSPQAGATPLHCSRRRGAAVAAASASTASPSETHSVFVRASGGSQQRRVFSAWRSVPGDGDEGLSKTPPNFPCSSFFTGEARWATRWRFSSPSGSCFWEARHAECYFRSCADVRTSGCARGRPLGSLRRACAGTLWRPWGTLPSHPLCHPFSQVDDLSADAVISQLLLLDAQVRRLRLRPPHWLR